MDKGLIPNRYAKALYAVGAERGVNDTLYNLMQRMALSFSEVPELSRTVANPFVPLADKTALLNNAVYGSADEKHDPTFEDFIKLLEQNGRVDLAWDIARAYIDIYRRSHNICRVVIASAAPLGEKERERLTSLIDKHVGNATVEYVYDIDPDLIGGFTVTINNERLDASVRTQLAELKQHLIN
ncbi:MAG: ATP synthase F1 subunit delta [Muribaculaceae bacterium]|nr:ATP synthase F1 subunit delta [Muribaculaceae bacterium]MDE6134344.1 ATP synthase F1 subunit delta [Muribaculaceae bacterium]